MTLTVSVIIPAFNEQERIGESVGSVLRGGADEVIVVDGGSTDDTEATAAAAGATVLRSERPGRAAQQNKGAALARGDVLLFLHADNRLHESAIDAVRRRLQELVVIVLTKSLQRLWDRIVIQCY